MMKSGSRALITICTVMKPNQLIFPARYFAQLFDHLEAQGLPCRDVLSAAQIRTLNDAQARLTLAQVVALLADAERVTGRHDLGFELGRLIKLTSHDILGYAFISAPTLDHILRLASRYYRLILPLFTMRYLRQHDVAEVLFEPATNLTAEIFAFFSDVLAISGHCQLMAVTQHRQPPYDIYVSTAAPAHVARYRELKGVRVHFGDGNQRGVRFVLNTSCLDLPQALADVRTMHLAEQRCKQMLQEFSEHKHVGEWVETMLRGAEDAQPKLEELAAMLNISVRTLDRQLEQEGLSFRELSARVRNERACELLLANARTPVSQIAYRLGYTDVSNFSRSFRKVNGVTPSEYRDSQQVAVVNKSSAT
jgi:AraC-like DNA-binding protein